MIYVNQTLLSQTGYTRRQLIGSAVASLIAPVDGQTIPLLIEQNAPIDCASLLQHRSGPPLQCLVSLRPVASGTHWIATLRHIGTALTKDVDQSGSRWYRSLFQNQSRPMWLYDDATLRFVDVNEAAIAEYGYSREEFLNMTILDIRPVEEGSLLRDHVKRRKAGGRILPEIWKHRRKDGSTFPVEIVSLDVDFEDRQVRLIEVNDVSHRSELEGRLRQAQKMEAVGQLASGIAHDFNNLLTVINGYASMLCEPLEEEHPMREDLVAIRRAGERAAALTRQLLTFSRKQELKTATLNLNEMILEMRSMLRRVIREDIELITKLDPAVSPTIADPTQIEQIILNLVINARDAITGHGAITIETQNIAGDNTRKDAPAAFVGGAYVMLSVRDTGCGMEPAVLSRIFEPFFTTKPKGEGTGLGLPTVITNVKQLDGHLAVESTPGCGTTFLVYLKTSASEVKQRARPLEAPQRVKAAVTVLLVEDDGAVREFIQRALDHFGYRVLVARDGQEALDVASAFTGSIDILISDVVMPKMNGRDVAEKLCESRAGMKVLYLSGYDSEGEESAPSAVNAMFLGKPFTPGELGRKVREMLED